MIAEPLQAGAPGAPVDLLLAQWGMTPGDPRLAIHPDDEMLSFLVDLHDGDDEQALCDYLRGGRSIADLLLQVVRWRHGERQPRVLDFASGYGRVTRFLLDAVPAERLTISDILAPAVEFQRRRFGVAGVMSASRPEDLRLEGPFDAILVTSLFTHLPEARFGRWLRALLDRLAPGGVLLFSTHDPLMLPAAERPASGFLFRAESEIAALDTADYGSTWADERFVRAALAAQGEPLAARRFPRVVCNFQDLWVVVRGEAPELAALDLRGEPEISVERSAVRQGALELAGWCAGRFARPRALEVLVDGTPVATLPVDVPRGDVRAARDLEDERCGFVGRAPMPAEGRTRRAVLLRAVEEDGRRTLLWAGRLAAMTLLVQRGQLRRLGDELADARARAAAAAAEAAALRGRVAAMQESRFWKLRDAWFALKRALRLTTER